MDEGRGGGAGEDHLGGADGVRPDGRDGRVAAVRAMARLGASVQAEQLRLVAEIAAECTAEARAPAGRHIAGAGDPVGGGAGRLAGHR